MTLTIDIPDDVVAAINAALANSGQPDIEAYLQSLIERKAAGLLLSSPSSALKAKIAEQKAIELQIATLAKPAITVTKTINATTPTVPPAGTPV